MGKVQRRAVQRGEALAMLPSAIKPGGEPGAFFFAMGAEPPANERIGDVAVVSIRGALEQYDEGCGENYESILARVADAMTGEDVRQAHVLAASVAGALGHDPPEEPDSSPPGVVVLRLSSPGGVVAGLNETVRKLQAMSSELGIPLVAYVDELAASAAYALACSCEEIYLPPAGMVGSIGVISHMWSIRRANDKAGIDVEVVASGEYKTDGNENVPITDDALGRERARVDKLAGQFFDLVSDARGLSVDDVAALEAGVFLGADGVRAGLADMVMGWDDFLDEMALAWGQDTVAHSGTADGARAPNPENRPMRSTLKALIAQTKKDLAAARTAKARKAAQDKLARLTASLADVEAYRKTKYVKETEEEESDAEDAEDAEDESEDDEPPKKDDKDEDAEDAEESEGDDDEDEAEDDAEDADAEGDEEGEEALMALFTSGLRGKKAASARGVLKRLLDDAARGRTASRDVAKMAKRAERDKLLATLTAKTPRFISKSTAKWLRSQPNATLASYLKQAKTPIIHTEEDAFVPDDRGDPGAHVEISRSMMQQFQAASAASGIPVEKFVAEFKAKAAHTNGVKAS